MDYCHVIICITVIQIKSSVACTHQPPQVTQLKNNSLLPFRVPINSGCMTVALLLFFIFIYL